MERQKYIEEQKSKNPPKPAGQPKKTLGKPSTAEKTRSVVRTKKPAEEKKTPEGQVLTNLLLEDVRSISYSNHDHLVYEFAVRWWYSLPSPWPSVDYDYSQKLKEKNLRRVDLSRFKSEPDIVDGLKKVYEQDCYSGILKDA